MKELNTVKDLIDALVNRKEESYLAIMKSARIPASELEKYYSWSDDHYTRNQLIKTDDFELLLICFEKGQQTPIHDFNTEAAWVHTVKGKLNEERFMIDHSSGKPEKVSSVILGTNCYSFLSGQVSIHQYTNIYESRTVSLNLYARPIEKWTEYDEEDGSMTEKTVVYHSILSPTASS